MAHVFECYESGTHAWTPPTVDVDLALGQMCLARCKRKKSIHIVVIPKIFYALFRRIL